MHTTSISCRELDRNGADVRTRHDQGVLVGTSYNCDSSVLHSSLMLSVARGLSLGLRVTPRLPGRLLKLRPPPIANPPLALDASRQFSSTRPKSAKYFRFEVDPEQPLNYRRWNTGTQIFGGIVVLSAAYYVLQYAPVRSGVPATHAFAVSRLYRKPVDGGSWTPAQNLRPGCA